MFVFEGFWQIVDKPTKPTNHERRPPSHWSSRRRRRHLLWVKQKLFCERIKLKLRFLWSHFYLPCFLLIKLVVCSKTNWNSRTNATQRKLLSFFGIRHDSNSENRPQKPQMPRWVIFSIFFDFPIIFMVCAYAKNQINLLSVCEKTFDELNKAILSTDKWKKIDVSWCCNLVIYPIIWQVTYPFIMRVWHYVETV